MYAYLVNCYFNSLGPRDTIWRHRSGSTLGQVMACCLMAPSHYLNQYWFTTSKCPLTFIWVQFNKSHQSLKLAHYGDVIMGAKASQITSLTIVYSAVYSDADQRKYQSSASLAFVWGIHRGPVNSPHKWPVTRKIFPFDDVIMWKITFLKFLRNLPGASEITWLWFSANCHQYYRWYYFPLRDSSWNINTVKSLI